MKNNIVIVYTKNGYKFDNGYGKFVNDCAFAKLSDACQFCEDNGIEYVVA